MVRVGDEVTVTRTFEQADFDRFAKVSGDDNPIHVDPEFAATTRFGRTLAHGMMLFSTLSAVIGTRLPGPGAWILAQELRFPGPTFAGDRLTIHLQVLAVDGDTAELGASITSDAGHTCCEGRTRVWLPRRAS